MTGVTSMDGVHNLRAALHPRVLELIIFPTEKCNFRCTYCYETFEVGKMKRQTIDGIKRLIEARVERNTLDHLVLSWFGGEPTLALDVMIEISELGHALFTGGKLKGFGGNTTTNGYLLNERTLRHLVSLKQNTFQISLDGYGAGHDVTRRYVNGKGTFERVWSNLLTAHRTNLDFQITLRLHQTAENGDSMTQLVDEIRSEFKGDERFSVFFKTIENLGGPNASALQKMQVAEARTRVKYLTELLRMDGFGVSAVLEGPESSRGEGSSAPTPEVAAIVSGPPQSVSSTDSPPKRQGYDGYICYASKPNSLAIRADGGVAKCTVLLDDPRNRVGTLNADGTVTLDAERMKVWMRGFKTFDPMELGCPAQNLPKLENPVEKVITFTQLKALSDEGKVAA